ncbi:MAG: phosphoenolpyruvate--protein phosphotransferase [Armatimonadota bacterium]
MTSHTEKSSQIVLKGRSGVTGLAVGLAVHWLGANTQTNGHHNSNHASPSAALRAAFASANKRLATALRTADPIIAPMLDAQRLMLDDPELRNSTLMLVETGVSPVDAVNRIAGELAGQLAQAESEYFRERAIDVRAVGKIVIEELTGGGVREIPRGGIVLAEELSPLDTALLAEAGVAALVTVQGGPTCHAAIIARAWGIPAVLGVPTSIWDIPEDTPLLVDGNTGQVIVEPSSAQIAALEQDFAPAFFIPQTIPVYANIGSLAETARAVEYGAEGVGLLRTEFMFLDRETPPSEDEQAEQYTAIVRQMGKHPVVIRTLDIGADKPVPFIKLPTEPNPQLGLRGVRLCLRDRELFNTQLRAILRASLAGNVKILLPMVTAVDEVRAVRTMLHTTAARMGIAVPPVGAMIEVPMAALNAPELTTVCDFFSLGTNDLMQFLLAADRQNAGVGYLHAGEFPGLWRLIEQVIDAAHEANIPVGVCGEWGADGEKLSRLVELGLDTVSVSVGSVTRVKSMFVQGK